MQTAGHKMADPVPSADPSDMSGKYNTPLTPTEQTGYQEWVAKMTKEQGRDVGADTRDYDMQGFYKSGQAQAGNGHFPDTFKKPSHPTFSTESKYSGVDGQVGGEWKEKPGGKWTFKPSATNLQHNSPAGLQQYFLRSDPSVTLENAVQ